MDRLSPELRRSIVETLGSPVIPLFVGRPDEHEQDVLWDFAGSGLLVEVDGVSGILTAEHVIYGPAGLETKRSILATVPQVYPFDSFAELIPDQPARHAIGTHIRAEVLTWYPTTHQRKTYDEWGPDLAFIRVPKGTPFERNLRATRINFYSWARGPDSDMRKALDQSSSVLAVVGAPGEWIEEDPSPKPGQFGRRIKVGVMMTAQEQYHPDQNGYDFVDAVASREPGTFIPNSFGGVSGGALWRFRDVFHTNLFGTQLNRDEYVLAGIAFWQHRIDSKISFVRCHGPRSIYERFLPEVRDWLKLLVYFSTSAPSKIDPVSCPVTTMAFVEIKMGRRQGARSGAYLNRYVTDPASAGQPPAHFHRNPPGRDRLAVFPRCSLLTYRSRYARRSRLEKRPTDRRRKLC